MMNNKSVLIIYRKGLMTSFGAEYLLRKLIKDLISQGERMTMLVGHEQKHAMFESGAKIFMIPFGLDNSNKLIGMRGITDIYVDEQIIQSENIYSLLNLFTPMVYSSLKEGEIARDRIKTFMTLSDGVKINELK